MKDTSLDKQLQKDLKDLIAELVEIAPSSDRDRVWRYLEKIYEARRALEKHSGPSLGRVLNSIAKTLNRRFDKNVARLLIEMSVPSSTSSKMKRKYSDSVNLAYRKKISVRSFVQFVSDQGGLNGCVAEYARIKRGR